MKIKGTKKEIDYIKRLLERVDHDCKHCIYAEGCETDTCETCADYIFKKVEFEAIK